MTVAFYHMVIVAGYGFLLRNKQKGDYYRPNDMAYCVQNHVINCNFLLLIETKLNGAKIIFVRRVFPKIGALTSKMKGFAC